ncbi:hypothetical protein J6590_012057 [Homalodisca vitripennis]|nr:hypothetical protein J6590_012057 [Homalodisca vitripennis]
MRTDPLYTVHYTLGCMSILPPCSFVQPLQHAIHPTAAVCRYYLHVALCSLCNKPFIPLRLCYSVVTHTVLYTLGCMSILPPCSFVQPLQHAIHPTAACYSVVTHTVTHHTNPTTQHHTHHNTPPPPPQTTPPQQPTPTNPTTNTTPTTTPHTHKPHHPTHTPHTTYTPSCMSILLHVALCSLCNTPSSTVVSVHIPSHSAVCRYYLHVALCSLCNKSFIPLRLCYSVVTHTVLYTLGCMSILPPCSFVQPLQHAIHPTAAVLQCGDTYRALHSRLYVDITSIVVTHTVLYTLGCMSILPPCSFLQPLQHAIHPTAAVCRYYFHVALGSLCNTSFIPLRLCYSVVTHTVHYTLGCMSILPPCSFVQPLQHAIHPTAAVLQCCDTYRALHSRLYVDITSIVVTHTMHYTLGCMSILLPCSFVQPLQHVIHPTAAVCRYYLHVAFCSPYKPPFISLRQCYIVVTHTVHYTLGCMSILPPCSFVQPLQHAIHSTVVVLQCGDTYRALHCRLYVDITSIFLCAAFATRHSSHCGCVTGKGVKGVVVEWVGRGGEQSVKSSHVLRQYSLFSSVWFRALRSLFSYFPAIFITGIDKTETTQFTLSESDIRTF